MMGWTFVTGTGFIFFEVGTEFEQIIQMNFNFRIIKIHTYGVSFENYPPVNKWRLAYLYSCELPTCFPKIHQFT